jgi:hypothetical protein
MTETNRRFPIKSNIAFPQGIEQKPHNDQPISTDGKIPLNFIYWCMEMFPLSPLKKDKPNLRR